MKFELQRNHAITFILDARAMKNYLHRGLNDNLIIPVLLSSCLIAPQVRHLTAPAFPTCMQPQGVHQCQAEAQ